MFSTNTDDYAIYVESPFDPTKRCLAIGSEVSTKYQRRNRAEFEKIAAYLNEMIQSRKGNYMAFFPSYRLMQDVYAVYEELYADENVTCLIQESAMREQEREEFLEAFAKDNEKTLVGFCIMGGIFSEGIDLDGEKLIGAAVVGAGIPQVGAERELLKQYFDRSGENGFDYAYRYPGMCKHAIATALAYLDASGIEPVEGLRTPVRTFTAAPKQPVRPASAAPAVNPNFPFPAPVPTSPSLMKALSDLSDARMDELAGMRRKLAAAVDPDAPKAVLEPSLVPYYNPLFADRFSWALELRIRCGSVSYVVKDIDGMAGAYVRGGTFSYGKKLTFLHTPEAFDEVSVRLLDLVATTVAYLCDITSSRSASYDFARSGFVAERQLPLSEHDIVYMLDLLRGRTISFEPAWSRGTTAHRSYEVAVESVPEGEDEASAKRPPLLAAKIAPAAGGSYDLRLPADAYCFASGDVAYLIDSHRARRADAAFAQHAAPFLSRLLPCRTPVHIAAEQVGEFCRMALPVLREYTDLTAPAVLDTVAPEPSFAMSIGVSDGLVTCEISVAYGDWSADLFSLGAPGSPFEDQRPGVPPRDVVAEFRVMDTAAMYFDFHEGGLAFEERDDESLFCLLTEGLAALSAPDLGPPCAQALGARDRQEQSARRRTGREWAFGDGPCHLSGLV